MGIYKYEDEDLYNGIISIDGYYRVNQDCMNNISKTFAIRIDTKVTPIFCSNCNKQVPDFYKLNGSRYGQVGEIECERCHSIIFITDTDNIVDELYNHCKNYMNPFLNNTEKGHSSSYTFDYSTLYYLDGNIFNRIEKATGFQMLKEFQSWADLAEVIECICKKINYKVNYFKTNNYFSDALISDLPTVIHTWFHLLTHLGILNVKDNLCYLPLDESH